jgi:hypothetical protein
METEFEYDHNARNLDRQLEEVMDSHRSEQEVVQAKEAEALPTEPPALDRLLSTTKDQVKEVTDRAKEASAVLREEMVRDRLLEHQAQGSALVEGFLKEAGMAGGLKALAKGNVGLTRALRGKVTSAGSMTAAKTTAQKRLAAASVGKRIGPAAQAVRGKATAAAKRAVPSAVAARGPAAVKGYRAGRAVRQGAQGVSKTVGKGARTLKGAIQGLKRGITGG